MRRGDAMCLADGGDVPAERSTTSSFEILPNSMPRRHCCSNTLEFTTLEHRDLPPFRISDIFEGAGLGEASLDRMMWKVL